jgi:signal transduction histidine kinase
VAKALTELHRGELTISGTQGSGTTVTIILPVAAHAKTGTC